MKDVSFSVFPIIDEPVCNLFVLWAVSLYQHKKPDVFLHVTHDYIFFSRESGGARQHKKTKQTTLLFWLNLSAFF